jgi:hypothetical protein
MKVGSTAGVISGLSPGAEKAGEDLQTIYVPNGTTDIIIIIIIIKSHYNCTFEATKSVSHAITAPGPSKYEYYGTEISNFRVQKN